MARMIPQVDAASLEHSSEAPVYEALRDELPDDYIVVHSYPWLRPWRNEGALQEGETDFVVLHPERGLLVLEVKGGDTIRHDGYRWFRDGAEGPREFQDPFKQAQKNMHALLEVIRKRSGGRIGKRDLVHGYAVVFPHMDYEGPTPAHAEQAIVIGRKNLPYMSQAIETAYNAWKADSRQLSADRFHMLVYDCLLPKFKMFRPISADVGGISETLLELTETQAQVLEGLFANDRVLIKGVAGSGKTFLALHRALAFARGGRKTLFICFNKALAEWVRTQVERDPATMDYRDQIDVRHFHGLAAELAKAAALPFEPHQGGPLTQRFWDEEVPDLIVEAAVALTSLGKDPLYDAIVVDEAQDFSLDWWFVLSQTLLRESSAPLYAFMDPNQSLRGDPEVLDQEFEATFNLTRNCRNTRRIAAASAAILELRSESFSRVPEGLQPRTINAATAGSMKGLVLQELRNLLEREDLSPRQIAVVGPASMGNGSLAGVHAVEGVPLVADAGQWRDGAGLLVTTARSFKGLEADVVLLYDLSGFGPLFTKEDLYVACTRARASLVAVTLDGECRETLEEAISSAEPS